MNLTGVYPSINQSLHQLTSRRALPDAPEERLPCALAVRRIARRMKLSVLSLAVLLVACVPALSVNGQTRPPVLISESTSTRAIALESVTFLREPFPLTSPFAWSADQRTRLTLFALNLSLQPGEDLSVMTAEAEDSAHRRYNLRVEAIEPVAQQEQLSAVTLRLSDDLSDVGDVLVRVSYRGVASNRVRVGIGHTGGGPPDDFGASPTLVPPYLVSGQVTSGASGFGGVSVTLAGPQAQAQTVTTDAGGFYSFVVTTAADDYALTLAKPFYNFSPQSRALSSLTNNQANINFIATRQIFAISGQVSSVENNFSGATVTLTGPHDTQTITMGASGAYSFNALAGEDYTLAVSKPFYDFTPASRAVTQLSGNQSNVNFAATRKIFSLSGQVAVSGGGFGGVPVTLSGAESQTTTTDDNGAYSFAVLAGEDYTITPSKLYYTFSPQSRSFTQLASQQPGISFLATRQAFTISGQVLDDNNAGLAGIEVAVRNELGGTIRTALSGADGSFSFPDLIAGYNYTVAATNTNFFTFTPQNLDALGSNLTLSLKGARSVYTIRGRALDESNRALAGVAVSLSGSQTMTATTDDEGRYSFAGLPAGGSYEVNASKRFYLISPQHQSFANLGGDREANFAAALQTHRISGRVTDGAGNGIIGIAVKLDGPQASSVRTGSDGHYALTALDTGDYTLTASIEQDRYTFAPSSLALPNIGADQIVNFTATFVPIAEPSYVLEYDGAQKTVDYGDFWEPYVDLGHFYWEFWAMPGSNAGGTYLLSDGYGGAHALLFGFSNYSGSEPGRYQLFGNTFDGYVAGQHVIFFASDEGPAVGEWGHFAVGWDGQSIITYFDGVPVGKKAFTGPRATPGISGGGNKLLIGGSDHNNLIGRIAQVRGYEGRNPLADANGPTGGTVEAAFAPQTVFALDGNLLSHYFRPAPAVADLSLGQNGITHAGTLRGTTLGIPYDCGICPPPRFVIDPTAPNFAQGIAPQPVNVPTPLPVPGAARVFDSFSRQNSIYLFNGKGGLGTSEGGSVGAQAWQTGRDAASPQPFGILNGRAVLLGNEPAIAWIQNAAATGNLDARVDRHPGLWGNGLDTGLSFRVVDNRNFFFAYTSESSNAPNTRSLTLGYYVDGNRAELVAGLNLPANWTTLRVVSNANGSIKVYANATLVYTASSNLLLTGAGAGLYNNASGLGLVNRWDNFTVYDAP
ncbi:MAG TPA: carboxypeptidase regulatory-like domain-containing protein [Pyrinomonadaceae bacterium]